MVPRFVIVAALVAAGSGGALAEEASLTRLLEEAAAASPEVTQARSEVQAERARIPQAGALPDPVLTLGIQNDSFTQIQIGTAETSFFAILLTQPLYWPGKRGLREQVATLEARRAEARLSRALLDLEGRVRRAWVGLLLVRAQVDLLDEQQRLWAQAEQAARSRYESGQVPQSDLLRAQLEQARLQQRKLALEAERANRLAEVNRLRRRPLDEAFPDATRLADLPDPAVVTPLEADGDAARRSPEMHLATLNVEQADRRVDLARKERLPDLAVTAGVMPRGSLVPMWQLSLAVGLPIFAGRKQDEAVDENEQRRIGQAQASEAIDQILKLRTRERISALSALNRANHLYRTQVLVLSSASASSTLGQYEVGRVPFAAVLEALSGWVSDRATYLASVADAQLVAIAQTEVSLDAPPSMGGAGGAGAMPGVAPSGARSSAPVSGQGGGAEAAAPTRGMGGM
jgi:outer membrane protein TolC